MATKQNLKAFHDTPILNNNNIFHFGHNHSFISLLFHFTKIITPFYPSIHHYIIKFACKFQPQRKMYHQRQSSNNKKVQWCLIEHVVPTLHRNDMTIEEFRNTWYTKIECAEFRSKLGITKPQKQHTSENSHKIHRCITFQTSAKQQQQQQQQQQRRKQATRHSYPDITLERNTTNSYSLPYQVHAALSPHEKKYLDTSSAAQITSKNHYLPNFNSSPKAWKLSTTYGATTTRTARFSYPAAITKKVAATPPSVYSPYSDKSNSTDSTFSSLSLSSSPSMVCTNRKSKQNMIKKMKRHSNESIVENIDTAMNAMFDVNYVSSRNVGARRRM